MIHDIHHGAVSAELQRSEAATHGLRRIYLQQISDAASNLKPPVTDTAVHEARKRMKKARATLRLLRPALGDSVYRRDNAVVRDAARPLGAVRDARALLETLDKLLERQGSAGQIIHPAAFRRALGRELAARRRKILDSGRVLALRRESLKKLQRRSADWKMQQGGWNSVGAGLKRVYAAGRQALKDAADGQSAEAFHEWRKQAKYLRYQLQVLEPLWPGPIGELADQVHKLTDYLGDDHDLFVLRERAAAQRRSFGANREPQALIALIDRRSIRLREKALILGRRIYEERPSVFEARFHDYWRTWRQT